MISRHFVTILPITQGPDLKFQRFRNNKISYHQQTVANLKSDDFEKISLNAKSCLSDIVCVRLTKKAHLILSATRREVRRFHAIDKRPRGFTTVCLCYEIGRPISCMESRHIGTISPVYTTGNNTISFSTGKQL